MNELKKGQKTKRLLYSCALELFRKYGYDNVSVDEIVKRAGTAKGTFYIYFNSKAEVIAEMFAEYDENYEALDRNLPRSMPVRERLREFIRSSCNFTVNKIGIDLLRVLYINQLNDNELEQSAMRTERSLYRLIRELLEEGQDTGIFRKDMDLTEMGDMLIRCMRGIFYEWIMENGRFDLSEKCIRYIDIFCEGILA